MMYRPFLCIQAGSGESSREKKRIYATFMDFKKEYKEVYRKGLWKVLTFTGGHQRLLHAVMNY